MVQWGYAREIIKDDLAIMFYVHVDVGCATGKRGEKKKKNSAFDHDKIKLYIIVGMIINSVEI